MNFVDKKETAENTQKATVSLSGSLKIYKGYCISVVCISSIQNGF